MSDTVNADRPDDDSGETLKLIVSWLWVAVPAGWGVYHVIVEAVKIFR